MDENVYRYDVWGKEKGEITTWSGCVLELYRGSTFVRHNIVKME